MHDIEEWETELQSNLSSSETIPEDLLEPDEDSEFIPPEDYDEFDAMYDEDLAELYEEFVRNQEEPVADTSSAFPTLTPTPLASLSESSIVNPTVVGTVSRHPFESPEASTPQPLDDAMQL